MSSSMEQVHARFATLLKAPFEVCRRDDRWLALDADHVAFAVDDAQGWQRLEQEAWVARRWLDYGVPAPRVLAADETVGVQVRSRLHGLTGAAVEERLFEGPPGSRQHLSAFGARLAASYGDLAARIRRAIPLAEAQLVGFPLSPRRQLDFDAVLERLRVVDSTKTLHRAALRSRAWLEAVPAPDALIHGDLHFFNLCCAEDGTIIGVFDLGHAGIDATATELLYVHSLGRAFVELAIDAYGPVDLRDVARAHVRIALDHLEWHGPGTPRHDAIIEWISTALDELCP